MSDGSKSLFDEQWAIYKGRILKLIKNYRVDLRNTTGELPLTAVPILPEGKIEDGAITPAKLSFDVATQAELDAETATRSADDATLQTNISDEASTRATADSTHAALTTTAHGGIVKPPIVMSWSADGDLYVVAHEALTLQTPSEAGSGTLAYTRALAASPTSFSSLTFPDSLAAGDILKVSLSGISGYKAATIPRSA